eukprot:2643865-Rhodomonas_salina.1
MPKARRRRRERGSERSCATAAFSSSESREHHHPPREHTAATDDASWREGRRMTLRGLEAGVRGSVARRQWRRSSGRELSRGSGTRAVATERGARAPARRTWPAGSTRSQAQSSAAAPTGCAHTVTIRIPPSSHSPSSSALAADALRRSASESSREEPGEAEERPRERARERRRARACGGSARASRAHRHPAMHTTDAPSSHRPTTDLPPPRQRQEQRRRNSRGGRKSSGG